MKTEREFLRAAYAIMTETCALTAFDHPDLNHLVCTWLDTYRAWRIQQARDEISLTRLGANDNVE